MTTTYYTPSGNPSAETRGNSSQVRAEFQAIASGFSSASTDITARGLIAGQTWSGTHTFPATTYGVTAALGASGTAFATIDYVNAVATSAALPGQTSKSDYLITSNGTAASWTNTINTSVVKLVDGTDKTKQVQIDASGLTTATTRKIIVPDRDVVLGGFTNLVVLRSTQSWTAPPGAARAKITVIDGGQGSGYSSTTDHYAPGSSGKASVSVRAIMPGTSYTATVGAAGAGASNSGPDNTAGALGGASSFAGAGLTTLTSTNGDINISSGKPIAPFGGAILYAAQQVGTGVDIGAGAGANQVAGNNGLNGATGAIIIEY